MAAKPGVILSRPFQRIQHAAHSVQHTARQQPGNPPGADGLPQGVEREHRHPSHGDIDGGGHRPGTVDPGEAHHQSGNRQRPDDAEQRPSPRSPQRGEAHRRVRPGDEEIDGGMIQLAQGHPALHCGVDTVVQRRRGVKRRHGQPIDGERHDLPHISGPGCRRHQHRRGRHAQHRTNPMGDGRPGPQAVVGVPSLLHRAGPAAGDALKGVPI